MMSSGEPDSATSRLISAGVNGSMNFAFFVFAGAFFTVLQSRLRKRRIVGKPGASVMTAAETSKGSQTRAIRAPERGVLIECGANEHSRRLPRGRTTDPARLPGGAARHGKPG